MPRGNNVLGGPRRGAISQRRRLRDRAQAAARARREDTRGTKPDFSDVLVPGQGDSFFGDITKFVSNMPITQATSGRTGSIDDTLRGAFRTAKPGETVEETFAAPDATSLADVPNVTEESVFAEDQSTTTPAATRGSAQDAIDRVEEITHMDAALTTAAESGTLDDPSQHAVNMIREDLAMQLVAAENDLMRAQQELDMEDFIFEKQVETAGLADEVDLAPLRKAVSEEGGVGAQTLQAIMNIAKDVSMSEAEKNEGIDLVLTRNHFAKELQKTVHDMVDNKRDLERLELRSDNYLLENAGVFLNPQIPFDVLGENDGERYTNTFWNTFSPAMKAELPELAAWLAPLPDDDEFVDVVRDAAYYAMNGLWNHEDLPGLLAQIAEVVPSATPAIMRRMFEDAAAVAQQSEDDWNMFADGTRKSATPFSQGMVAAIFQAGEESAVFTREFLELVSKSVDLHMLIDEKSGGKSGVANLGNTRGVGGLTESLYEHYMGEPWNANRGLKWELQALLEYIADQFDGDPMSAVRFWRDTGEWGGSTADSPLSNPSRSTQTEGKDRSDEPFDEFISTQEQVG